MILHIPKDPVNIPIHSSITPNEEFSPLDNNLTAIEPNLTSPTLTNTSSQSNITTPPVHERPISSTPVCPRKSNRPRKPRTLFSP